MSRIKNCWNGLGRVGQAGVLVVGVLALTLGVSLLMWWWLLGGIIGSTAYYLWISKAPSSPSSRAEEKEEPRDTQ
jgi:hypothetical protein